MLILQALAKISTSFQSAPVAQLVLGESRSLPWDSTVVVITAAPTDELFTTLFNMRRVGRKIALVQVGGSYTDVSKGGLQVYHIPDSVAWRELEKLDIKVNT
jgi:hypothetical protein